MDGRRGRSPSPIRHGRRLIDPARTGAFHVQNNPCLWFDGEAEQAAKFYVSLLPDSRIETVQKNPADGPAGKAGMVLVVEFTLAGQRFMALNGGMKMRIYPRGLVQDRLRRPGRGRPSLGCAARRWRQGRAMRLAAGPFWRLMADRADSAAKISRRARPRRRPARDAGDAQNGQARHRRLAPRL